MGSNNFRENWIIGVKACGWKSNTRGLNWLYTAFDPASQEKATARPGVLICDSHGSHINGDFIVQCIGKTISSCSFCQHIAHILVSDLIF